MQYILLSADGSCLQCIEISSFQQWVGRQNPFPAHAASNQTNDGAHADPEPTDAGLTPEGLSFFCRAAPETAITTAGLTCSTLVPVAQHSLAGLITSSRHQRWIE
jgi:hypothetical protein